NNKTKTIIATLALVGLLGLGMSYALTLGSNANAQLQTTGNSNRVEAHGPMTPSEFIAQGGRSIVTITPNAPVIDVSRGSSVTETFTFKHSAIINPLPQVTVGIMGIQTDLIPPSIIKSTTPHERAEYHRIHGNPMPGIIDLNSLVTYSQKSVTLAPGQSSNMTMTITIPKSWPDDLVGKTILFNTVFSYGKASTHDLLIEPTSVGVHVVS
ncbi:MAG: hypothetical protein KGL95_07405, partial [Patescibacteria group bacterium]|nr:hypothetical protein [Patescibacteria group bacterium]